jgi:hypothetical protein
MKVPLSLKLRNQYPAQIATEIGANAYEKTQLVGQGELNQRITGHLYLSPVEPVRGKHDELTGVTLRTCLLKFALQDWAA